jgi:hypothetical protein
MPPKVCEDLDISAKSLIFVRRLFVLEVGLLNIILRLLASLMEGIDPMLPVLLLSCSILNYIR